MDFIRVAFKENRDGTKEYYPALQAVDSQDLVIRGGQFVAIWDEVTGLYSRKLSHIPVVIDRSFETMVREKLKPGDTVRKVRVFDNQIYSRLMGLIRQIGDIGPDLDRRIVYADETPTKGMAATFKMDYSLNANPCPAWNELVNTLYSPEERIKIEWAIGSIFAGSSIDEVQKFYVFFGPPGSGKSTILNIIEMLFEGHTSHFSAYDMGRGDSQFSLEPFSRNPLVAIDQDGDLSRIELNKNLNSIVSHDKVLINAKGKNLFEIKPRATLFVGTNEPIKISNRKSGLFRRLVDIQPTGKLVPEVTYHRLMNQIPFELGAIATHCQNVFESYGPTFLSSYRSTDMMYRTNDIFNFVQDHRLLLSKGITLKQAHKLYLDWCEETETRNIYKQFQFRDLLMDYFETFHDQIMLDTVRYRSYFENLKPLEVFDFNGDIMPPPRSWLELREQASLLDDELKNEPAQYATKKGTPSKAWDSVTSKLRDLDTSTEHYTKVPDKHIVIDFDLKDQHGKKSLDRNREEASKWPPTYAEVSRSGQGIHLHYNYDGDISRLAPVDIHGKFEVKTLLGGSGLRRKLTQCNDLEVATISSGLPLKGDVVISKKTMAGENSLRELIIRALNKEINAGTKSNMDFIEKVLRDAQAQEMVYDVTDMWDDILQFAMQSTNQRSVSLEIANRLPLKSEQEHQAEHIGDDKPVAYFDCEVFPNLFAIGWIYEDAPDEQLVKMLNPTPQEVENLFESLRLVGFNNRLYDNHILWARTLGYSNEELYNLSKRIIFDNDRRATFGAAYSATYADIYDYASEKKSLKQWEIELGLPHKELDLPWDEPVPEDRVEDVLDYMGNDVLATRAVAKARSGDFRARQILADLSGLEIINTTRQHTEQLIFGDKKDTSRDLVYTDLHEMFPGYKFNKFAPNKEKSTYKGEIIGEGGLVRATPGMYTEVAVLDVASMHPTSIVELNLFGEYTDKFKELLDIRLLIKAGKLDEVAKLFDGRLAPYVSNPDEAKMLSFALKIVINTVYGLTVASFPNRFRDENNLDNIVAKRGALFMMDLKEFIEGQGYQVVHIKTDSVKIPNATPDIIDQVIEFGAKYGYTFEHESTYERFCLVNQAVYIARRGMQWSVKDNQWETTERVWEAVGAQFQHPVVFKTLFSKEELTDADYIELKRVTKGAMYLLDPENDYKQFIGRFGAFVPVINGRELVRIDGDKIHAVTGTKGYTWALDGELDHKELEIDVSYFKVLVDEALRAVEEFGSYAEFISE